MASAAKDRIENQIAVAMQKSNEGKARDEALKQLRELGENFHYVQVRCGLASAALNGFAYDLEAAKRKLDAAVQDAQAEKFTVNPDGSITYPAGRRGGRRQGSPGRHSERPDGRCSGCDRPPGGQSGSQPLSPPRAGLRRPHR
ncbi:hypothetical protein GCM10010451_39840 [Streptomyces virens]|jgi:hypothetical protein|uniref:Uncharacterized protein n=1 Tax=Streptomyces virens TaxID=285572 RepID=A0ABP6PQM0_9ACTN